MRPSFSLEGKVALVTGGQQGMGAAIALALAEAGADVAVHGLDAPEPVCAGVRERGRRALALRGDLSKAEPAEKLVPDTVAGLGRLDILVNNAGTIRRAAVVETTDEDWEFVINVNLNAVFRLSRSAGRHMLAHGGGKIVNVASLLAFQGGIRVPAYAASKHGVAALTKALANEWAGSGVNVNAVAPGYIATDNTTALRADPVRSKQILERIPAGRWGEAEDIVGAVVFLASPAAAYVHGHVLVVDGGWMAR
jgi:2-dehydro-3-deoxy-D-gluconate 5-dehydrogenase